KSNTSETIAQKEQQLALATNAKDSLQVEFNIATARLDSLTGINSELQGALAGKNEELLQAKSQIEAILKKRNVSKAELKNAEVLISELNTKIDRYVAEIKKLREENKLLTAQNTQLSSEKQQLSDEKQKVEQNLSAVEEAKKNVEDLASTLHASNLAILAVNLKGDGKEKVTTTAKRADLLRITFDIDENRVAPSGVKSLYVKVVGPDGNDLTKGGTFTTRDGVEKSFASKVDVNYEQGKRVPVSFDFKQDGAKYNTGDYKIEIYHNGFKIGEGTKTLKKGGLF
ncbi:MAG: hypothetical protein ACOVQE_07115, partial [Chitinophagaceae bacterium]